jgi:hypothetical protein
VQVPEKGEAFAAYLKEAPPASTPPARGARPQFGTDLVIRDLRQSGGAERTISDVTEFALAKGGTTLVYAVAAKKDETNGIYTVAPLSGTAPVALISGKGKYAKPTWDRAQKQLAFLAAPEDPNAKQSRYRLYLWDRKSAAPVELIAATTPGLRDGYVLFDRAALNFSRDGSRVFVGVANAATAAQPAEAPPAPADDKVVADLWRWNDDYVQPMQKVRLQQERTRSYRGVFHIAQKRFVQLADPAMAGINPSDDGRYAIGTDDRTYRTWSITTATTPTITWSIR